MKLFDRVYKLLKDHQELRDDDKKLTWSVWALEGLAWNMMTKEAYLKATSAESITRARRKVQEEYPLLRGKTYQDRQILAVKTRETYGSSVAYSDY